MENWSEHIWKAGEALYSRILRHPFIRELAAGSLSPDKFARYLAQDELYLPRYCSLMHRLADLLPDEGDRFFMHEFADAGGESEQAMHRLLMERFSVDTAAAPSEVTEAYCTWMESAVASGNVAVATAAMLPCSWVYNNVGEYVRSTARLEGNPYREWIEEYGDDAYGCSVMRMVAIADSLAAVSGAADVERMGKAFLEALGLEFAFWDYGYSGVVRNPIGKTST